MKKKSYRHGDVILVPVDGNQIPEGFAPHHNNHLAEGEKTGHYHAVVNGEILVREGERMLRALEGAQLFHQEHSPDPSTYPVEPGLYQILIQREYDDEQDWRSVQD